MEIYVDDKVLVELTVKRITEDKYGVSYSIGLLDSYVSVDVTDNEIKDIIPRKE